MDHEDPNPEQITYPTRFLRKPPAETINTKSRLSQPKSTITSATRIYGLNNTQTTPTILNSLSIFKRAISSTANPNLSLYQESPSPVLLGTLPEEEEETIMGESDSECRPLGFLIGLPFAVLALAFSLIGAVVWILGTIFSCFCPCCGCFAGLANLAVDLIKMPVKVIRCFIDQIPC